MEERTDFERALICHILDNPLDLEDYPLLVGDRPFTDHKLNCLLTCMKSVYSDDSSLPAFKLNSKVKSKFSGMTGEDGNEVLSAIRQNRIHSLNGMQIYHHVVNIYQLNQLSILGGGLSGCGGGDESADDLLSHVESELRSIDQVSVSESHMTNKEAVKAVSDKMAKIADGDKTIYTPTGIRDIDKLIIGVQRGTNVVIGARASQGKSALGVTLLSNMSTDDNYGGLISIEMSTAEMMERLIQVRSNTNMLDIARNDKVTQADVMNFQKHSASLAECENIIFRDTTNRSLSNIKAMCKRMKRDNPKLGFIVIDYLQKIRSDNPKLMGDEVAQIKEASGALTDLSRDLDITIFLLAQLNRGADGSIPTMASLKGASDIEQDAHIIMLIHRDLDEQRRISAAGEDMTALDAKILIVKNRGGRVGDVGIKFNAKTTEFRGTRLDEEHSDGGYM